VHFVVGALLSIFGAAMVWVAIPKNGKPGLIERFVFFTELYLVAAVTSVAIGVTMLFLGLPA
jgi:putative Mn2+ efflux pump MntP